MGLQILLLIIGLVLIIVGAEFLVNGSSSIARKFGVSEFIIGLTIVGMGTSAPEMVVSFLGAFEGNADISIGNIIGSNIFNTLLILGLTMVIMPIKITKDNINKDIPMNIFIVLLLILLGASKLVLGFGNNVLSRIDGLIFLILFICYMYYSYIKDKKSVDNEEHKDVKVNIFLSICMMVGGLGALIYGGKTFVDSATNIAHFLQISDKFIAITILAGGTSMPEIATCIVAALKKKGQLALGNVIGSNIFNILLILGGSALIRPLNFGNISIVDIGMLLFSTIILIIFTVFAGKKKKLGRINGIILLLIEVAYMIWLFKTM